MAFDLSSISSTKQGKPPRVIVYGEHGLGKTTFAAGAPAPIFIPTEDGLDSIDAKAFPLCQSYEDILSAIGTLYNEPHDFRTAVLDSLDWAEALIAKKVEAEFSEADRSYGKDRSLIANFMREMLEGLNALRLDRGMAIVLTAHCEIRKFDDPTGDSYDRFELKLSKHCKPLVQEWADVVGFTQIKAIVRKEDAGFNKKRGRAIDQGERVLRTEPAAAYDAKNRYGLPPELPLLWSAFADSLSEAG